MPMRLETQRPPGLGRSHTRRNNRLHVRGYTGAHAPWGDLSASPGNVYATGYPTITASDATNAGRIAGLGFIANPTSAWTTGQGIVVNGFAFNWSGSAWAAGNHA
jgi:hypothetical protein